MNKDVQFFGVNMNNKQARNKFNIGDLVYKVRGSKWRGQVVGWYSTELTPDGYAVESSSESGSVQIYPASALELDELIIVRSSL
jgi:hypothetical protein